jgi:HK97 family phage prohead protease
MDLLRMHAKIRIRPVWDDGGEQTIYEAKELLAMQADRPKLKALDENGRLNVTIMASTPDIDETGEIVEVTAFSSSIEKYNDNPKLLAYHDMKQPVGLAPGRITKAGLLLEGFVSSARPDIQQLVLDGVLSHASIGFFPKEVEWDEELDVLRHLDLELIENSLVPIPANLSTWVTVDDVKSWRSATARKTQPETPAERPEPEPEREPEPADDTGLPDEILAGLTSGVARVGSSLAALGNALARE